MIIALIQCDQCAPSLPTFASPRLGVCAGCQPQPGAASQVPACRPLHWQVPDAEARLYSCPSYGLGLVHGEVPPAIRQLRAGASPDKARALLTASSDKECNGKLSPLNF